MPKKEISWRELVSKMMKEEKKNANFAVTEVIKKAGSVWKEVKAGTHPKYSQGATKPGTKKLKSRKSSKSVKSSKSRKSSKSVSCSHNVCKECHAKLCKNCKSHC